MGDLPTRGGIYIHVCLMLRPLSSLPNPTQRFTPSKDHCTWPACLQGDIGPLRYELSDFFYISGSLLS